MAYPEFCCNCGSWVWHRSYPCNCTKALYDNKETIMTPQDLIGKLVFCRGGTYFYIGKLIRVNDNSMALTLSPHRVVYDIQDKPYQNTRTFGDLGKIVISVETVEEIDGTIEKPIFKE
jgi:hypothetical protein